MPIPLFADRAILRLFSISILIAGKTKNGRAESTRWSVWQSCFWGCDMTLGTHQLLQQFAPENMKPQKAGRMTQTSTCWTGEDRLWESKFYIPFQPQKWASNKSNSSVTSSCASCGFLRSRLESQSWNSFNPFPIVNRVSGGVPTPPDSGKTPQLKTSKLAQNCGKIEVLHLQPSYGIWWSHEIEILPPM